VLGIPSQCIRQGVTDWMTKEHLLRWKGMSVSQHLAHNLNQGHHIGNKTIVLSLSRVKIRSVTAFLISHNTLRRHLHVMGLVADPTCRFCGLDGESSNHVPGYWEALAERRFFTLGDQRLDPKDIRMCNLRAILSFIRSAGLDTWFQGFGAKWAQSRPKHGMAFLLRPCNPTILYPIPFCGTN
jgi:hypothetical protein